MSTLLIRNARNIITMDDSRRRVPGGSLYAENGVIRAVGTDLPYENADTVIDARHKIVFPGFVNCHHHLSQVLTRNVPWAQDCELFDWLVTLYEVWRFVRPEDLRLGALTGLGELLKTGCTTAADHFYCFPRAAAPDMIDWEIEAARELGIRFHPTRGSMSRGKSRGGLPPDDVVQREEEILSDTRRVIEAYHDPAPYSMCRVGVAPCSPFSVTTELMKESAALARAYKVRLHTHLAETRDEEAYCREVYGCRPLEYMEQTGWLGEDVWYAHGIFFSAAEIRRMGRHRVGVAHCPVSNHKLSSGTAKVPQMLAAGVRVGLGVDGSASADSSNMLFEVRVCHLTHKLHHGPAALTAEEVLWLATRGGAQVLGRDDIGSLEVGKAADLFLVDTRQLGFAGGLHDDASLIVLTGSTQVVDTTIVGGRVVVSGGRLVTVEEERVAAETQAAADRLLREATRLTGVDYYRQRGRA